MNVEQKAEAGKTVVGEFSEVKHVRGILSMGSYCFLLSECATMAYSILLSTCSYCFNFLSGSDRFSCLDLLVTMLCLEPRVSRKQPLYLPRYDDPDSGCSSFSMLLGNAPHLDGNYAIFGKDTKGDETLRKLEQLPTRREGIFVMPTERITIHSTYYYDANMETCEEERSLIKRRLSAAAVEIERQVEDEML
ncbi:hypothetical protein RND71_002329 [Anisodus tanguticus]|uniref:PPIase cyclophilin-type domain-containing protein n=1 Tax=Anisodus tanguticus TaxID=243964 RepID=A0AAE1VSZ1_9SOLA|nr:hypothetical protein RND71_002329 [Anisodus tanguticus]